MIWLFLILGASGIVVVFAVIALYVHLRHHLQAAHPNPDTTITAPDKAPEQ